MQRLIRGIFWRRHAGGILTLILIGITALVATAGCGGKDAKATLQTYLDALIKGDYKTAYGQLTSNLRGQLTVEEFQRTIEESAKDKGAVVSYEIKDVEYHGATSTLITVVLHRKKGSDPETLETVQYGFIIDNGWKLGNY